MVKVAISSDKVEVEPVSLRSRIMQFIAEQEGKSPDDIDENYVRHRQRRDGFLVPRFTNVSIDGHGEIMTQKEFEELRVKVRSRLAELVQSPHP